MSLVARLAAQQWGVLSLDELRSCGLVATRSKSRVRSGHLHPLYRGVYAVGHTNLALEGALPGRRQGLRPHRAPQPLLGRRPVRARALGLSLPAGHGHRQATPRRHPHPPHDHARRHPPQGHPGHHPRPHPDRPRRPARLPHAQTHRPRSPTPARDHPPDPRHPRPPRPPPRHSQPHQDPRHRPRPHPQRTGGRRPRSPPQCGVPTPPHVNQPINLNGRTIIPDFRWPDQHLVIEADGAHWHDNQLTRQDDAEKQAILEAAGERVIRITWAQAITQRAQTLTRIKAAGAPT